MTLSVAITAFILSLLNLVAISSGLGLILGTTLQKNKGTR